MLWGFSGLGWIGKDLCLDGFVYNFAFSCRYLGRGAFGWIDNYLRRDLFIPCVVMKYYRRGGGRRCREHKPWRFQPNSPQFRHEGVHYSPNFPVRHVRTLVPIQT